LIELFQCQHIYQASFRAKHLKSVLRTLAIASKVSVRLSHQGLLSLQALISLPRNETTFIESVLAPLVTSDER